jgi:hypothetical protein
MSHTASLLFFSVALLLISPVTTSREAARGDRYVTTMNGSALSNVSATELTYAPSYRFDRVYVEVHDPIEAVSVVPIRRRHS